MVRVRSVRPSERHAGTSPIAGQVRSRAAEECGLTAGVAPGGRADTEEQMAESRVQKGGRQSDRTCRAGRSCRASVVRLFWALRICRTLVRSRDTTGYFLARVFRLFSFCFSTPRSTRRGLLLDLFVLSVCPSCRHDGVQCSSVDQMDDLDLSMR